MRERLLLVPLAVLLCFVDVVGQAPATADAIQRAIAAATMVPLHTHPSVAGQPDYGWWAGGPSWKASFHDGLAFYPYRGSERERVQLHWRTASITAGGEALPLDACGSSQTDDCYQTHYPGVTELYELSEHGVEQKFVFDRRPARPGAIVVTGRLSGDFEVDSRTARHEELLFCVDGEPTVRYGKAFAIGADGRRVAVPASVDGDLLRLHVPAEFVAAARFPLTIDPLIGNALINSNFNASPATTVEVACSTELDQMVVSFVRQFSLFDRDAFSLVGKQDFTGFTYHWIENSASYGVSDLDVAYCQGQRSYVIASYRVSAFVTIPFVYVQRDDQMQNNAGTTTLISTPVAGYSWTEPSVGGGYGTCGKALAAWKRTGSSPTQIACCVVDCANPSAVPAWFDPHGVSTLDDSDQPDVMPMTRDGLPWRVVWRSEVGGIHEIRAATVSQSGSSLGFVGYDGTVAELEAPQIAGSYDASGTLRQVMVWQRNSLLLDAVRAYDFSLNLPIRTIASGPSLSLRDVVADHLTGSNFLMAYSTVLGLVPEIYVARLGGTGEVVDSEVLGPYGSVGMCFETTGAPDFLFAYDDTGPLRQIRGATFVYPADAESVPYGAGCATSTLSAPYPFAGNHNFAVHVGGLAPNTLLILAAGVATANASLQPLGIPCPLLVSPVATFGAVGGSNGATFPIPLPDDPAFLGDLYVQAILPFDMQATEGLRIQVR
ncbi:MAG: hypothetical protein ACE37K_04095 [Planctomycetota bacterium]